MTASCNSPLLGHIHGRHLQVLVLQTFWLLAVAVAVVPMRQVAVVPVAISISKVFRSQVQRQSLLVQVE
jgi:hypothetical protein